MKNTYHKLVACFLSILFLSGTGCSDFLDEKSVSDITIDAYVKDQAGFEDLVRSCYSLLRNIHRERKLVLNGTDLFTQSGWNKAVQESGDLFELYDVRLSASVSEVATYWEVLYKQIGRANTVITRSTTVEFDEETKNIRVAEAKFLRAFAYFYLVQTWGDIPMPLAEVTTPARDIVKASSVDVYTQIIKDLTDAEAVLPAIQADYGRATKGAAQFLLARVYLTRGWNYNNSLGGSGADFGKALEYADKVIDAYPLVSVYKNLFPLHSENPLEETFPTQNDMNSEVIFAVQYSSDVQTSIIEGTTLYGNDMHHPFGGDTDIPGALGRTSDYNRHLSLHVPTPTCYRMFDPDKDSRYAHNYVDALYALSEVKNFSYDLNDLSKKINIAKGDTVVVFRPWNRPASLEEKGIDVGGTKKYAVLNTDQFGIAHKSAFHTSEYMQPLMWKFWEPGIPYGDTYGTFDYALFRSAEAYLIAAEAIVKGASGGKLGAAENYYNKVLDRAVGAGVDPQCAKFPEDVTSLESISYRATSANITIDLILDERARELMGEYTRWFDLKRTGKLIERTKKMNPWAKVKGAIEEFHLVRPIPQTEIDRSTTEIEQNAGY